MKLRIFKLIVVTCFLQCIHCQKVVDSEQEHFTVEGTLIDSQGPVQNAKVSIDGVLNWTTTTSNIGKFTLQNISKGEHTLNIENHKSNDSFIEISEKIVVNSDLVLGALRLPTPVVLFEIEDANISSLNIRWSLTDAEDFVEYKLFRHDTPGLDETTGLLVFVATSRMDTSFVDTNLLSNETYYYRVYLMNQYGRLGGSNIIFSTTKVGNLIPDGGFEDPSSIINNWYISRHPNDTGFSTTLDDSIKTSGNYSLHNINKETSTGSGTTMSLIKPIYLAPNQTYKLSCWVKAEDKANSMTPLLIEDTEAHSLFFNYGLINNYPFTMDWTFKEITFLKTTEDPLTLTIYLSVTNVWIDSLSLVPVSGNNSPH